MNTKLVANSHADFARNLDAAQTYDLARKNPMIQLMIALVDSAQANPVDIERLNSSGQINILYCWFHSFFFEFLQIETPNNEYLNFDPEIVCIELRYTELKIGAQLSLLKVLVDSLECLRRLPVHLTLSILGLVPTTEFSVIRLTSYLVQQQSCSLSQLNNLLSLLKFSGQLTEVDINVVNQYGLSALDIATAQRYSDLVKCLKNFGALTTTAEKELFAQALQLIYQDVYKSFVTKNSDGSMSYKVDCNVTELIDEAKKLLTQPFEEYLRSYLAPWRHPGQNLLAMLEAFLFREEQQKELAEWVEARLNSLKNSSIEDWKQFIIELKQFSAGMRLYSLVEVPKIYQKGISEKTKTDLVKHLRQLSDDLTDHFEQVFLDEMPSDPFKYDQSNKPSKYNLSSTQNSSCVANPILPGYSSSSKTSSHNQKDQDNKINQSSAQPNYFQPKSAGNFG